jgi:DNA repair protein RecN (Recombination protein N)
VKPLARIASGGEISRVMLALKGLSAVGSGSDQPIPTLIFDEIDVGVGGRTAHALGEKLAALGRACQVLCVTHLPQIASRAAGHYRVEKSVTADRTVVEVRRLEGEERVEEVARMLGGTTATARTHARELIDWSADGTGPAVARRA